MPQLFHVSHRSVQLILTSTIMISVQQSQSDIESDGSYVDENMTLTCEGGYHSTASSRKRCGIVHPWIKRVALTVLPSPIITRYDIQADRPKILGTTAYLNGVRGVAAVVVYAEHFLMAHHPHLLDEYGSHPEFFQLPGVRLLYSGSVSVALFFIISGFSLSLRPLEAIRHRDWEQLHRIISSATIRRGIRLILPPTVVTFLIMLGVRFNLFEEHYSGTPDMDLRGPLHRETFWAQVVDWTEYVLGKLIYPDTWLSPLPNVTESNYAEPMYTISREVWSSLLLFLAMVALSRVKRQARLVSVAFLVIFSAWCMRRDISCFLVGMMLAEFHIQRHDAKPVAFSRWRTIISSCQWSILMITGIWLSSIPHAHGSYGSSSLGYRTVSKLVPWNPNVYYSGAVLIMVAMDNMPTAQAVFSSSFAQYLGDISFGLYLVHWPVLAAWGWKVVPTMWSLTGNNTTFRYEAGFCLAVLIVTPVVFWLADVCWRLVDLPAIRLARRFETQVSID